MLAENIGKYRTIRNMTQAELAKRCSVSKESVKYWENGTHEPSAGNLLELSKALGVLPEVLLGIRESDYIYVGDLNEKDKTMLVEFAQRLMNGRED